ncbi:MAG: signal recognition particle protein [Actinobacteria bacterium]|nr:signal recognition particle protein [Actinomycetota bacterium]
MFESLTDRLNGIFQKLGRRGRLSEADVDAALREVRLALLEADVNFKVARDFVARVRERAVGQEVVASVTPAQQVVKVVHDNLVTLLGGARVRLATAPSPPTVVLLVGLQGSGKTTTAAKLALAIHREEARPLLVAADTYRPAAVHQLVTLAQQVGVEIHAEGAKPSPLDIAANGVGEARRRGHTHVIVDTAGRQQLDADMMDEVEQIRNRVAPHETLLVVDAMTGQQAVAVAEAFHARAPLTGLILTKLDGDARGGAALSIRAVTGVPVKYVGLGEKIEPLEAFHPDRLASRILGMGDVVTLVERAQELVDEARARALHEKIRKATFGLDDFLEQLHQVQKMGPLSQVLGMIPGLGGMSNDPKVREALEGKALRHFEAIILSMTRGERANPASIDGRRRRRIALGSGTSVQEVNQLLKQFRQVQQLMQAASKGRIPAGLRGMMGR